MKAQGKKEKPKAERQKAEHAKFKQANQLQEAYIDLQLKAVRKLEKANAAYELGAEVDAEKLYEITIAKGDAEYKLWRID